MGNEHITIIALFISDVFNGQSKSAVSVALQELFEGTFQEIILPTDDAPESVPRVILNSQSLQNFSIEVFPNRINFRMPYASFVSIIEAGIFNNFPYEVVRIGLVRGDNLHVNQANQAILERYTIETEVPRESTQAKLHFMTEQRLNDRQTNVWSRFESDSASPERFFIEFDVNSSNEDLTAFTTEQLHAYLTAADTLITNNYDRHNPTA